MYPDSLRCGLGIALERDESYRLYSQVDGAGAIHTVARYNENTSGTLTGVAYRKRAADGTWGGIETIEAGLSSAEEPQVATDALGQVHVAYTNYKTGEIRYAMRSTSGTWTIESLANADKDGVVCTQNSWFCTKHLALKRIGSQMYFAWMAKEPSSSVVRLGVRNSSGWSFMNVNVNYPMSWPRPVSRGIALQGDSQGDVYMTIASGTNVLFGKLPPH